MSSPITTVVVADPVATLLSAAAIRAARSIREGYEAAEALRVQHAAARDAREAAQSAAREYGVQALEREAAAAETALEQLAVLAERLGAGERVRATRPTRPAAGDPVALAAYTRGLRMLADELHAILLTEAARRQQDLAPESPGFEVPVAAAPGVPSSLSQRLLERIAHLRPFPGDIERLARELDAAPPGGERAALLAMELRRNIQQHAEAVQRRTLQEATATVVRQSLRELGYQVEEITDTLFVEGGVAHFRRRDWGDYMVRMRVERDGVGANFNVIRAVDAGGAERSAMDYVAEDRWCAEFPALSAALEARGVRMSVTRRVEPGELPVQLVERSRVPRFEAEESGAPAPRPRARSLR